MAREPDQIDDATLTLLIAPGIGPATIRRLRERFGSDEAAVEATISELASIDGIGRPTAAAIRGAIDDADPQQERAAMRQADVRLVLRDDADYPPMLAVISDAPEALWVRGELTESDRLALAMVGSRRCSSYGREQAGRFASLLSQSGLTIVSGGALGVDAEAHRGALRVKGRTIAVLGCGLDVCYPEQHDELYARIADGRGAMVSEHPMGVAPLAQHFPRRNRIISGLSLGVLVIEAATRSGALITARLAAEEHGREVMALPGRVDSPASAGCLKLLQDGAAALVVSHADVLRQLDASSHLVRGALEAAGIAEPEAASLFDGSLTDAQQSIIIALADAGAGLLVDQLAARTSQPMSALMADLTLLQIQGRIVRDQRGVRLKK